MLGVMIVFVVLTILTSPRCSMVVLVIDLVLPLGSCSFVVVVVVLITVDPAVRLEELLVNEFVLDPPPTAPLECILLELSELVLDPAFAVGCLGDCGTRLPLDSDIDLPLWGWLAP